MTESNDRHVLVNFNLSEGMDTAVSLLSSAEFVKTTLDSLLPRKGVKKADSVQAVWDRYYRGKLSALDIVKSFAQQSRRSLSFYPFNDSRADLNFDNLGTPDSFLTQFGPTKGGQWYGPIIDNNTAWFIRALVVKYPFVTATEGDKKTFTTLPARWHIVAEVKDDVAALHWNGFSVRDEEDPAEKEGQFPYWLYIPKVAQELSALLKTPLPVPNLHELMLHTLLDRYDENGKAGVQHLRIRALSGGVALNASGKKDDSPNAFSGVRTLTRNLALAAIEELQIDEKTYLKRLDRALLRTLLHEWGVKSYQVCIDGEKKEHLFRATAYFGDDNAKGPDSFAHLICYANYGGSTGALRFLSRELGYGSGS